MIWWRVACYVMTMPLALSVSRVTTWTQQPIYVVYVPMLLGGVGIAIHLRFVSTVMMASICNPMGANYAMRCWSVASCAIHRLFVWVAISVTIYPVVHAHPAIFPSLPVSTVMMLVLVWSVNPATIWMLACVRVVRHRLQGVCIVTLPPIAYSVREGTT